MQWKRVVKYTAFGLIGALLTLLIWGAVIEPRLVDFKAETAVIPNLPPEWEGERIALIADLQIGMWFGNESTVTEIVKRIVAERPAAVLIAGDFVYKPTDEDEREDLEREDTREFMNEINESLALLKPLIESGIPVYAVLGNHDYGMSYPDSVKNERVAVALRQNLEKTGIRVLENQVVPLILSAENGGQKERTANAAPTLFLAGIGSLYANNARPPAALAQIPDGAPRIVFMHNPDSFIDFPPNAAPLALAGHTHGGQIRIPFTENWSWMALMTDEKIQADGWIENFGQTGNRLYVNRGIGFSSFPVRINCRPELTLFTLQSGKG